MQPPDPETILNAAAEVRAAEKGLAIRIQWHREAEAKCRETGLARDAARDRVSAAWDALASLLKPRTIFGPDADQAAVTTGTES